VVLADLAATKEGGRALVTCSGVNLHPEKLSGES
jgi:hypothetical protein